MRHDSAGGLPGCMHRRLWTMAVWTFGFGLGGCFRLPPQYPPAPVRAYATFTGSSDADIQKYIQDEVAVGRDHLKADQTLKTLQAHETTLDHAKWSNVGLSFVSTVVGTVAANQSKNKTTWSTITGGLGALSTAFIAVRDDKDLTDRIATCGLVIRDGSAVIDAFEAKWLALALNIPPADPKRAQFVADLSKEAQTMVQAVDQYNGKCH